MLEIYNEIVLKRIQELIELRKLHHNNTYMQNKINNELTDLYDIRYEILKFIKIGNN